MAFLQVSFQQIFSVNRWSMWSSNLFAASSCFPSFSWSRFFSVQVFQGSGFSGSESNLKVQVLEVAFYNHLTYPHDFSLLTRGNKTFLLEGEPVNNERSTIFEQEHYIGTILPNRLALVLKSLVEFSFNSCHISLIEYFLINFLSSWS